VLAQALAEIDTPRVDWGGLSPLLILLGGALVLVLAASLAPGRPPRWFHAGVTVATGAAALVASAVVWSRVIDDGPFATVADAVVIDGFSVFFFVAIASAVVLSALLSDDYVLREGLEGPELYILMLLSASGGVVMASANDLIVFFLGLEILSIALYVLAGFHVRKASSREAGLKYFVLGAFSSAFLLYGIAFVYGATGTTNLAGIADFLAGNILESDRLLLAGFALMLVGLGFKTSTVPFHVWTPDVYQGAPTPVTSFMASASKAAAFAGLLRIFVTAFGPFRLDWQPVIFVLAIATLAVGAFYAIVQTDVKRMLAYSSISHAGFVLVGVHAASDRGVAASLFYLLSYTFMVIGSFAVVTLVGRRGDARHDLGDYRGLGRRRPALALAFTVFLLAQAGVPFTSGFLAKFYVIGAAVDGGDYALGLVAMLSSVVAAFLYLRIVVAMYMGDDEAEAGDGVPARLPVPAGAALAIGLALAFTIVVGVVPGAVVDFARDAVPVLISAGG
jgi:NADH-quinone oxidoreductase subunit N